VTDIFATFLLLAHPLRLWSRQMLERKGGRAGLRLTTVTLANKLAPYRVRDRCKAKKR
jgi:hypothetical protein